MKQTSIEWLVQEMINNGLDYPISEMSKILEQAKEMEKEQLCKMYVQGRKDNHLDYYPEKHANETYDEMFKKE
jgi:hypothetical protein